MDVAIQTAWIKINRWVFQLHELGEGNAFFKVQRWLDFLETQNRERCCQDRSHGLPLSVHQGAEIMHVVVGKIVELSKLMPEGGLYASGNTRDTIVSQDQHDLEH